MPLFYQSLLVTHVIASVAALVLFWVPITTRKGALNHRRFGGYYQQVMLVSLFTGALMALLLIMMPFEVKPDIFSQSSNIGASVERLQRFAMFLIHLSILMYCNLMMGRWALSARHDRSAMRRPSRMIPAVMLVTSSLVIGITGLMHNHVLMMIFAPLGLMNAISQLRFTYATEVGKHAWLIEHLSGYIGSGIGAYTAFFAFGGRTLLADIGAWQFAFWIAPGILGAIAIIIQSRKLAGNDNPYTQQAQSVENQ